MFSGKKDFESQIGDFSLGIAEQVFRLAVDFKQGSIFLVKDEEGVVGILYQLSITIVVVLELLRLMSREFFTLLQAFLHLRGLVLLLFRPARHHEHSYGDND